MQLAQRPSSGLLRWMLHGFVKAQRPPPQFGLGKTSGTPCLKLAMRAQPSAHLQHRVELSQIWGCHFASPYSHAASQPPASSACSNLSECPAATNHVPALRSVCGFTSPVSNVALALGSNRYRWRGVRRDVVPLGRRLPGPSGALWSHRKPCAAPSAAGLPTGKAGHDSGAAPRTHTLASWKPCHWGAPLVLTWA